jgi:hypothetical protein
LGAKRDEITRNWRRLHDKNLHDLQYTTNTFGVIISRRTRWTGRVARMVKRSDAYGVLVGKRKGAYHLEDLRVYGRIILKWIFRKWDGRTWT